jgi:hypothetical protein
MSTIADAVEDALGIGRHPFAIIHDAINAALDLTGHGAVTPGRETGQVEYKLNEAKLWLGVVPGAVAEIVKDADTIGAEIRQDAEHIVTDAEGHEHVDASPPASASPTSQTTTATTAAPLAPPAVTVADPTSDLPIPASPIAAIEQTPAPVVAAATAVTPVGGPETPEPTTDDLAAFREFLAARDAARKPTA